MKWFKYGYVFVAKLHFLINFPLFSLSMGSVTVGRELSKLRALGSDACSLKHSNWIAPTGLPEAIASNGVS
jgi:hypothetical protein